MTAISPQPPTEEHLALESNLGTLNLGLEVTREFGPDDEIIVKVVVVHGTGATILKLPQEGALQLANMVREAAGENPDGLLIPQIVPPAGWRP